MCSGFHGSSGLFLSRCALGPVSWVTGRSSGTGGAGKLGNPKFRERAAPEVVSEAEAQQRAALERRSQLEQILEELTL